MSLEEVHRLLIEVEWAARTAPAARATGPVHGDDLEVFARLAALARYELAHGRDVDPPEALELRRLAAKLTQELGRWRPRPEPAPAAGGPPGSS